MVGFLRETLGIQLRPLPKREGGVERKSLVCLEKKKERRAGGRRGDQVHGKMCL